MTKKLFDLIARLVIIAILVMAFPGTVLADGGSGGYEATANGYHVALAFSEPAKTSVNEFHVLITDSMGMPVKDAVVEVIAMPKEEASNHEEEANGDTHGMAVWGTFVPFAALMVVLTVMNIVLFTLPMAMRM